MNISKIKTAFKIANVTLTGFSTKLKYNFVNPILDENGKNISQDILTKNVVHTFIIVIDGEVFKIASNQTRGGIKKTISLFQDGGNNGILSEKGAFTWYYLFQALIDGKCVEIYMIYQKNFKAEIKGLLGYHRIKDASINFQIMEKCCFKDAKKIDLTKSNFKIKKMFEIN